MSSKIFFIFSAYFLCLWSMTVCHAFIKPYAELTANKDPARQPKTEAIVNAYIPSGQCSGVIAGHTIPCKYPLNVVLKATDNFVPVLYISEDLKYLQIIRRPGYGGNCNEKSYVRAYFKCADDVIDPTRDNNSDSEPKLALPEAKKPYKFQ